MSEEFGSLDVSLAVGIGIGWVPPSVYLEEKLEATLAM